LKSHFRQRLVTTRFLGLWAPEKAPLPLALTYFMLTELRGALYIYGYDQSVTGWQPEKHTFATRGPGSNEKWHSDDPANIA